MVDESIGRALWVWLAAELAVLVVLFGMLWASLFGDSTFLASVSRPVRLAGLAFLAVELAIPAWVYYDLRRQDDPGVVWLHAAAMPVVNLFGLVGYLAQRGRDGE